jgi:hypothetical protein
MQKKKDVIQEGIELLCKRRDARTHAQFVFQSGEEEDEQEERSTLEKFCSFP